MMHERKYIVDCLIFAEKMRRSSMLKQGEDFANVVESADMFYDSIHCPAFAPSEVRRAIVLKFLPDLEKAYDILKQLTYDGINKCYCFTYAGMFHGVEPDGYIHT